MDLRYHLGADRDDADRGMHVMTPKDGGPAFPVAFEHHECTSEQFGMTLRDYFAAKAMQAYVTAWATTGKHPTNDSVTAEGAYDVADAMLAQRSKS